MSKVIFKMTFKHPNLKDTVSKNISHVNYIATRSGVDKTITEADLKKELEKGIEDLGSDNETYVKYINERPKSHGLFGPDGIEDLNKVQQDIEQVNSFIWRGIVSIKEEDAKRLGYINKDQWQDMLRKKIPDIASEMNIRVTNLRWVAAVHMEKGHPHAHIMLWEKEPEKTLGIVKTKTLENIRKSLIDEIFEEERMQILNEKNLMRDLIKDLAQEDISKATKLIKEVKEAGEELKTFIEGFNQEGVVPRVFTKEEKEISEKLERLASMLPGKGRIALKFMPEDVKAEVRSFAEYILEKPEFTASLAKSFKAVEDLTKLYTSNEQSIKLKQQQYLFIVSNIASSLNRYGIDKTQIIDILKAWTNKQDKNIDLSIEDKYKILDELNIEEKKDFESKDKEDIFNNISIKLLEEIGTLDVEKIKEDYIQDQVNKRNAIFNELIQKDLAKLENNIYVITDKGTSCLKNYENLSNLQKSILKNIEGKELSANEILEDKKLRFLIEEEKSKNTNFELKKYDATIIKGYFGDENNLNFEELKKSLADKFISQDKQNEEYNLITKRIAKLVENNIVEKNGDNYSFTKEGLLKLENVEKGFSYTSYDANVVSGYIERSGGILTEEELLKFLSNKYQTKDEIDKQYKYLIGRLEKNVKGGYVEEIDVDGVKGYSITEKGNTSREQIINPEAFKLKQYLEELEHRGIISESNAKYSVKEDFQHIINNEILSNIKNNVYDTEKMKEENNKFIEELLKKIDNSSTSYMDLKDILKFRDIVDPVTKAKDNAYKDILDRVSQIILKGAAESQKENVFYVDEELSQKAVDFIKNINNQINLMPEQTKVFHELIATMVKLDCSDKEILNNLLYFMKEENIKYPKESIEDMIKEIRENGSDNKNVNILLSKKIDYYLSIFKIVGDSENIAFKRIEEVIKRDIQDIDSKLNKLREDGFLKKIGDQYKLTNKGIEEFLNVKDLDKAEKEILKMLEINREENNEAADKTVVKASFKEFLDNKEVFSSLYDKDPEEFKVGKYDIKVKEMFGENNSLTFSELEKNIYNKYTDKELNINTDKAEIEIELLEKRIEKLAINGYVKLDKDTETYSFTEEGLNEINNLKDKMEFTRYDATVTLGYIDKAENNILTAHNLRETLELEIVNKTAKEYFEKFTELLESKQAEKYVEIDESGEITSTTDGLSLSRELHKIRKYFYQGKGTLTEQSLKEMFYKQYGTEFGDKQFTGILENIDKQIEKGHVIKDEDTGLLSINEENKCLSDELQKLNNRYFYKSEGILTEEKLKKIIKDFSQHFAEKKYQNLMGDIEKHIEKGNIKKDQETGVLTIDKEALSMSFELKKLNKYLSDGNEALTEEKVKNICVREFGEENANKNYQNIINQIEKQIEKGNIIKNNETGEFKLSEQGNILAVDLQKINRYFYYSTGDVTEESLKEHVNNEFGHEYQDKQLNVVMEQIKKHIKKGTIEKNESGEMKITEDGKILGSQLQRLSKLMKDGPITEEKLKDMVKENSQEFAANQFEKTLSLLNKQVELGYIDLDKKTGVYQINKVIDDVDKLLYQIYKEGGTLNKNRLKEILEKNFKNKEAENQFQYLIKRLDSLKKDGYLCGGDKEYILTEKGIEKREDLLIPQRELLRGKLEYLERLGLINRTDQGYEASEKYYKYMKNIAISKEEKIPRESEVFSKDIAAIIDRTQDKADVGKIERTNKKIANGKYINGEYEDIKIDYESIRGYCNIADTTVKTLNNMATVLLVSGVVQDEVKEILHQWNFNSNSNINTDKIDEIIEKAYKIVSENDLWGKISLVSSKDWKEMFYSLGFEDKDMPTWMYKGENWESYNSFGLASVVSNIWKGIWKELERQRLQVQAQAEHMKRNIIKQQAAAQNKSAIKEQIRKNKDRGIHHNDEFEI